MTFYVKKVYFIINNSLSNMLPQTKKLLIINLSLIIIHDK